MQKAPTEGQGRELENEYTKEDAARCLNRELRQVEIEGCIDITYNTEMV